MLLQGISCLLPLLLSIQLLTRLHVRRHLLLLSWGWRLLWPVLKG